MPVVKFKQNLIPYCCTRCGYETQKKHRMYDHLYKRKKICQGTSNDIQLTDIIKDKIMENRIYHIPKEVKPKESTMVVDDSGYVYIFYSRASKNIDENVYKIGKTAEYISRTAHYMKGGNMLLVLNVKNRHNAEIKIKRNFKIEFIPRRDYGIEYFEGDLFEMVILMKEILSEDLNEIIVDFEI
jgi:hypothetical protein